MHPPPPMQVKAILVNIFGGIMRCDVIASGIVNAAKQARAPPCPALSLPPPCAQALASPPALRAPPLGTTPPCLTLTPPLAPPPPTPQVDVKVPLIVRLEGTNVERGKEILKTSDMAIISANDLDDAATKGVASLA